MDHDQSRQFCSQCGSRLSAEARFCSACGARAQHSSVDPPQPPPAENAPIHNPEATASFAAAAAELSADRSGLPWHLAGSAVLGAFGIRLWGGIFSGEATDDALIEALVFAVLAVPIALFILGVGELRKSGSAVPAVYQVSFWLALAAILFGSVIGLLSWASVVVGVVALSIKVEKTGRWMAWTAVASGVVFALLNAYRLALPLL